MGEECGFICMGDGMGGLSRDGWITFVPIILAVTRT
jgi:hypothetical protein